MFRISWILIFGLLTAILAEKPVLYKDAPEFEPGQVRALREDTTPLRYDIHLQTWIHLGQNLFTGHVVIKLRAESNTNQIVLQSRDHVIQDIQMFNSERLPIVVANNVSANNELTIDFQTALVSGQVYDLEIDYTSNLRTNNAGFYRSTYRADDGSTKYLATTQFESSSARYAFPGYDEPAYRTPFGLKITHGDTHHAISNMPILDTVPAADEGFVTTTFQDTPSMSTYLLAFIVSDFLFVEGTRYGLTQRVFVRPNALNMADFALEAGIEILEALRVYYEVPYDLPKMDQAAIPDFAAGAMENWGLVTYREPYLLYDSEKTTLKAKIRIASVIAHEYAHQWFGDLVTPKTWTYNWMKEGMAQLFEYFGTDLVYPEWKMMELFIVEVVHNAFRADATNTTYAMTPPSGTTPSVITYDKSGSVLRMLQHALTPATFKKGLTYYLEEMKYSNGVTEDLTRNLAKAIAEDGTLPESVNFAYIMDSWTTQKGFPVIKILRENTNRVSALQSQFVLKSDERTDATYWIPLNFATKKTPDFTNTAPISWIPQGQISEYVTTDAENNDWIIFNKQQTGYYRVNYDNKGWALIIHELVQGNHSLIHHTNRAQLIDDAFNLARANQLDYQIVLDLLRYLSKERDYLPWAAANVGINYLNTLIAGTEYYQDFRSFVMSLVNGLYKDLGVDPIQGESTANNYARIVAIKWACTYGSAECLTDTSNRLLEEKNGRMITADYRESIYCHGLRAGSEDAFVYLFQKMQSSTDASERSLIVDSLGCSENPKFLKDLLEATIGNHEIRFNSGERAAIVNSIYQKNIVGLEQTMEFLIKYPTDANRNQISIPNIVNGIAGRSLPDETARKFDAFLATMVAVGGITEAQSNTAKATQTETTTFKSSTASKQMTAWVAKATRDPRYLPKTVKPVRYDIDIRTYVHAGNRSFTGKVLIHLSGLELTNEIVLMSRNLAINPNDIILHAEDESEILALSTQSSGDELTITFNDYIEPDLVYLLEIAYRGNLLTGSSGFYQSSYTDANGNTKYLGATQFESNGARTAFPCFDEPGYRTKFGISITHDTSVFALSNMPVSSSVPLDNEVDTLVTKFEDTPLMSTYLVAFIISDFEYVESNKYDLKQRVYARPNGIQFADFGLASGVEILNALQVYTGVVYDLPKMDQVAVPDRSGAMENWGLVTYSENLMLFDPETNTFKQKIWVASLIAHELAHQWFGDLVTPKTWVYNWMKEGMATVFEYHATDLAYPEWGILELFNYEVLQNAFKSDASAATVAMTTEGGTPTVITYDKSGSVLRMLQHAVGPSTFQKGLNYYLNEMKLDVAETDDLTRNLEKAIREDGSLPTNYYVDSIMDSWTLQKGYPVVNVIRHADGSIELTQKQFVLKKSEETITTYYIPFNMATANNPDFSQTTPEGWLVRGQLSVAVKPTAQKTWSDSDWIVLNKQQTGYYRVNYDKKGWNLIIRELVNGDHTKIHRTNRAQLVDDVLTLARADQLGYDVAFDLLRYLSKERDYLPWAAADSGFTYLNTMLAGTDYHDQFLRFARSAVQGAYQALGVADVADETILTKYARIVAIKWACILDISDCRSRTTQILKDAVDGAPIDPNIKEAVYCNGLRASGEREFTYLWTKMQNTLDQSERRLIIDSLGCSENPKYLTDLLEASIGNHDLNFKNDERTRILSSVYTKSALGLEQGILFLQKYSYEASNYGVNLNSVIEGMATRVSTTAQAQMFNSMLTSIRINITDASYNTATASVNENMQFKTSAASNTIKTWLNTLYNGLSYLPATTTPVRYDLHITTNVHAGTRRFDGVVLIHLVALEDTNTITLFNRALTIRTVTLYNAAENVLDILNFSTTAEVLTITLLDELKKDTVYILEIEYNGNLQTSDSGFYRSSYPAANGATRYLGVTQFESTGARAAFPCYDEPRYRTKIGLKITHHNSYSAVSNMPVLSSVEGTAANMMVTTFDDTPSMPTYLLAFLVSDFVYVESDTYTPQRLYMRPTAPDAWSVGFEAGVEILHALENYLDVPYGLPKMDQVAVPDKGGAMENWGLVTYMESYLLFKPNSGNFKQKKQIATVVAHEFAHQWFGDLVTPKTWDYNWMKEGMANLFGYIGADLVYPEMKLNDLYSVEVLQNAFRADAVATTKAMTTEGGTPSVITYDKSGSVLRMIQNALGVSTFKKGLKYYLEDMSFKSGEPNDLTRNIEKAAREDSSIPINYYMESIMNSWTLQKGYPVVTVTRRANGNILLSQKHFSLKSSEETIATFYIPYNFATASYAQFGVTTPDGWIARGQMSVELAPKAPKTWRANDWIILNLQQTGYYRVNYDTEGWNLIINELVNGDHNKIHYTNRAQLVDDALVLARAGQLSYITTFDLLRYLKKEGEYLPWAAADNGLTQLHQALSITDYFDLFKRFVHELVQDAYTALGVDDVAGEPIPNKYARLFAIKWACTLGSEDCRTKTAAKLTAQVNGVNIAPDIKEAVYCNGLRASGQNEFVYLYERFKNTDDQSERQLIIDTLGCSENPAFLRDLLESTLGNLEVRFRFDDRSRIVSAVYTKSAVGLEQTIEFLLKYYSEASSNGVNLNTVSEGIASRIYNSELAYKFNAYLDRVRSAISEDAFNNAKRIVDENLAWTDGVQSKTIGAWLESYYASSLPSTTSPVRYDLHITTNVHTGARAFSGNVLIHLAVEENTKAIKLNNRLLNIGKITLYDAAGVEVPYLVAVTVSEILTISFMDGLPGGVYVLEIDYTADLQNNNSGFYRSQYIADDGSTRYIATTQFEATGARNAFPCFDEPRYRATFKVKMTHDASYHTISNMPVISVEPEPEGNMVTTSFEETPKMPSYILAFIVSDFVSITGDKHDLPHRVFTRPNAIQFADFALDAGIEILYALEQYYEVPYGLPKMDQASLPDFQAGAMENWGLVTYREPYLLFDKDSTNFKQKIRIAAVISHEFAHQWFGDLVTPEIFDYNWLKEGVATLYEFFGTDLVYPEWKMMDLFIVEKVQAAFRYDAMRTTVAMTTEGGTPRDITYDKSGSVLRMWQHAFGLSTFQKGMKNYLTDKSFGNAEPADLTKNLEIAIREDGSIPTNFYVESILDSWTLQKGFPVVKVIRNADGTIELEQKHFALRTSDETIATFYIPYNLATATNADFSQTTPLGWIARGQKSLVVSPTPGNTWSADDWIVVNKQQTGYYRVNYDARGWELIINELVNGDHNKIHYTNRAQLVDDVLTLARADQVGYDVALNLIQYLKKEGEYLPWAAVDTSLSYLYRTLAGTSYYNLFKRYVRELIKDSYRALGVDDVVDEATPIKYARLITIKWACMLGSIDCHTKTANKLTRAAQELGLEPDVKEAIYCHGLRGSGQTEFVYLFNKMQRTEDQAERQLIIDSLGCSENPTHLKDLLETTAGNHEINFKTEERQRIVTSVYSKSMLGAETTIDFLQKYFNEARNNGVNLDTVITGLADQAVTSDLVNKLTSLLGTVRNSISANTYNNAITTMNANLAFANSAQSKTIENWLVKYFDANSRFLPTNTMPERYDIHLTTEIHTGERRFTGKVIIQLHALEESSRIGLFNRQLTIDSIRLVNSLQQEAMLFHYETVDEILTITFFDNMVRDQVYTLEIDYHGDIRTDTSGFYRSSYRDKSGNTKYLGITQFESTGARTAFPCFDEPGYRTPIALSITHSASYHAVSNMPVRSTIVGDDNIMVTIFDDTPSMSTYLLAFLISDFVSIESNKYGLPQKLYVRDSAEDRAAFGLEAGVEILQALQTYLNVEYVLPKMDQAAIPDKGGAMENWGLVTYTETYLLFTPDSSTFKQKKDIASVIAHEFAHQWFGDHVTPKTWDFNWMKEGMATLFEFFGTDLVYPEMKLNDLYTVEVLQNAFREDASASTKAMTTEGGTPSVITYDKSGSVLRMWQHAFGLQTFKKGLKLYLDDMAFKAADADDLIRNMEIAVREDNAIPSNYYMSSIMDSWTLQKGYPVVTVTRQANGNILLSQKHFAMKSSEETIATFYIPYNFATASYSLFGITTPDGWIARGQMSVELAPTAPKTWTSSDWIILNLQQTGYYRVNYDTEGWYLIINELMNGDHNKIHYTNRAQLVDDALVLARAGQLSYSITFDLLRYLKKEGEYLPWAAADNGLTQLHQALSGTEYFDLFKRFVHELVQDAYTALGVDDVVGEPIPNKYARLFAIKWACTLGSEDCRTKTAAKLTAQMNGVNMEPDVKEAVYCNGLRASGQNEFVYLYEKLKGTDDQMERRLIIQSLGCSENRVFLKDLLETTVGNHEVNYRSDDRSRIVSSVYTKSALGVELTIGFLQRYYNEARSYGVDLNSVTAGLASRTVTPEEVFRLNSLLFTVRNAISETTYNDAMTRIQENAAWTNGPQSKTIGAWLEKYYASTRYLPTTTYPVRYDLHISTNVHTGARAFSGNVLIHLVVSESTREIQLHNRLLTITAVKLYNSVGEELMVLNYSTASEVLTILLLNELMVGGVYVLEIDYTANLQTNNSGFYRSQYVTNEGTTRYLGATQFEATGARNAFPGYDEPKYRAVFNVKITHDASYNALSNMPVISVEPGTGNMVTTSFDDTPKMPSYILAFIVSDYVSIQGNKYGLTQRVFTRPNAIQFAGFGLDAGIELLHALEEYYGVAYDLPKMDQASIPDFEAGAMENWGLVTYREPLLHFDPASTTFRQKIRIAAVISHEYAHQWFGDLVTPEFFDYNWLKEGVAALYEYFGTDLVYSEWKMMDLFLVEKLQNAFKTDALATTSAMTTVGGTPSVITYDKSGSVLRMWQHAFGLSTFQKGMRNYLLDKSYGNANPDDLIRNYEIAIREDGSIPLNFNVASIMNSWILQKGYPVVKVIRNADGSIELEQKHFSLKPADETGATFYIPFNFATANNADFSQTTPTGWFARGQKSVRVSPTTGSTWTANDWIVLNKQQTGYYRVNYDARGWDLIINELVNGDHNKIHYTNRAQLVDDALTLARAEQLDYEHVFYLLEYLKKERDYIPWASADSGLTYLNIILGGTNYYGLFKDFVHELIEDAYTLLGVDDVVGEPTANKFARMLTIKWACVLGSEDCRTKASAKLTNAMNGGTIEPDVKEAIYCHGLRASGQAEFVYLWEKMQNTQDQAERQLIIDSLSCSENPAFLKDLLESAIGNHGLNYREDERPRIFNTVYTRNIVGLEQTIAFLETFYMEARINGANLDSLVSGMASRIVIPAHADRFDQLLEVLKSSISEETYNNAKTTVAENLAWENSVQSKVIQDWLEYHFSDVTTTSTTPVPPQTPTTPTEQTPPPPTTTPSPITPTTPTVPTTTTAPINPTTPSIPPCTGDDCDDDGGASTLVVSTFLIVFSVLINFIL